MKATAWFQTGVQVPAWAIDVQTGVQVPAWAIDGVEIAPPL